MPTNMYGPRDNFNLESAQVLPALIHRIHNAKTSGSNQVEIWGDGSPLREFLHVTDFARACLILMNQYDESVAINIGSGQEISIEQLANLISKVVGYSGKIVFNETRPNGTPRKLLDSSKIAQLGWTPRVTLEEGIVSTYAWFLTHHVKEPMP